MARLPMIVLLVCIGFVAVLGDSTETTDTETDTESDTTTDTTDDETTDTESSTGETTTSEGTTSNKPQFKLDFSKFAQLFNPNTLNKLGAMKLFSFGNKNKASSSDSTSASA